MIGDEGPCASKEKITTEGKEQRETRRPRIEVSSAESTEKRILHVQSIARTA
jgi:hypothetical protein